MQSDLDGLTEEELGAMIEDAQRILKHKQESKRREVMSQIKELASKIGVNVEISDTAAPRKVAARQGYKVPAKYQNPKNLTQQWSGRGMMPKWLRELVDQGRTLEEFKVR